MKLLETIAQRNCSLTGECMEKYTKDALQVTKEIVIKFIETNRVSPASFDEIFPAVYKTVLTTVTTPHPASASGNPKGTPGA